TDRRHAFAACGRRQAYLVRAARLNSSPAPTIVASRPGTCRGVVVFAVVPSPSWPLLFAPQAQTVPSPFTARLWAAPAAIDTTCRSPMTCTGRVLPRVVPLPNCPALLSPHA